MSSLFTFNSSTPSYHQPAPVPSFEDTFADDSDNDDNHSDDGHSGGRSYNHHAASTPAARSTPAPSSSLHTPPPPLASSSSSPSLPGGYDFEPQSEPAALLPTTSSYTSGSGSSSRPPSVPSSTRPNLSSSASASPFASRRPRAPSAAAADETDNEADLYGRQQGGVTGGVFNWRGLVGRLRGHQSTPSGSLGGGAHGGGGAESHGLLFSHDDSDETDAEGRAGGASYPPSHRNIHLPLPSRPPAFAPPPGAPPGATSSAPGGGGAGGRVFGGGSGNDGVFANLSAKPDGSSGMDVIGEGPDKDEVLPTYDDANRDSTPPYWETTVITPGSGFLEDDVVFDGLPVGNFFSFAWNILVSMSFQFVGFLLTYLLHTTHAAKNGSRAGLGITLIQLGFYLKQRTDGLDASAPGDATGLNGAAGPSADESQRWSWWGSSPLEGGDGSAVASATATALGALPTQVGAALSGALEASDPSATGLPSLMGENGLSEEEMLEMSAQANEWMAFLMVTIGSFLLIGGCLSYWRAVRWARAIRQGQGPGADAENMISVH
ncbi:hypothetical protein JCM6882_008295 [Rhodosporidiobolus microsporus]